MSDFTPSTDELIESNAQFAANFGDHDLQVAPMRKMAVVACMDLRMDPLKEQWTPSNGSVKNGEAHILRNAGGIVADDVIRSLCLSLRALGTRETVLMHHTDCGLQKVTDDGFRNDFEADSASSRGGQSSPSSTRTPMCASRCNGCTSRRSSTPPTCAASSTT